MVRKIRNASIVMASVFVTAASALLAGCGQDAKTNEELAALRKEVAGLRADVQKLSRRMPNFAAKAADASKSVDSVERVADLSARREINLGFDAARMAKGEKRRKLTPEERRARMEERRRMHEERRKSAAMRHGKADADAAPTASQPPAVQTLNSSTAQPRE